MSILVAIMLGTLVFLVTSFLHEHGSCLPPLVPRHIFQEMLDEIPPKCVTLRMEPAAILAAVQTKRGQFQKAKVFTAVIEV